MTKNSFVHYLSNCTFVVPIDNLDKGNSIIFNLRALLLNSFIRYIVIIKAHGKDI